MTLNIREDWGTLNEVGPGLFRLRLFNPRGALLINTWFMEDNGSLAVVDPGWPWTLAGLEAALALLGQRVETVRQWLYTHSHVDHMGLAAILSARSDAPHIAYQGLEPHLERWHSYQDQTNDWSAWGETAFAEPWRTLVREAFAASRRGRAFQGLVHEFGEARVHNAKLVDFGDVLRVGTRRFQVIDARGHDPHHIAFFEPDEGLLFAGDVVLAAPTPLARGMDDDLTTYMHSLERLAALPIQMLIPGHGVQRVDRIEQAFDRARGFLEEHRNAIYTVLQKTAAPVDLYSLALATTPNGQPLEPLSRWWVHLSNLDSHLQREVSLGHIECLEGPVYRLSC